VTAGEPLRVAKPEQLLDARVILWAGHCSVHKLFRPEHCDEIIAGNRTANTSTTILVHPECTKEVVDKADMAGSTEFIINTIDEAEPGSRWAIGTEVHLVNRLAQRAKQRGVHVGMLSECQCLCTTMSRIDQPHLLWVLDQLCQDPPKVVNRISVHPEVRGPALDAVNRMLELVKPSAAPVD